MVSSWPRLRLVLRPRWRSLPGLSFARLGGEPGEPPDASRQPRPVAELYPTARAEPAERPRGPLVQHRSADQHARLDPRGKGLDGRGELHEGRVAPAEGGLQPQGRRDVAHGDVLDEGHVLESDVGLLEKELLVHDTDLELVEHRHEQEQVAGRVEPSLAQLDAVVDRVQASVGQECRAVDGDLAPELSLQG